MHRIGPNSFLSSLPGEEYPPGEIHPRIAPRFLLDNLKRSLPLIASAGAIAAILLGMVFLFHFTLGVSFGELTRDPAAIFNFSLYIGFLSQTGIFFWAGAGTSCLLAGTVFLRIPHQRRTATFFLSAAFLSLLLGTDDVFLFHEVVFPFFGIPENVVYGSYIAAVLGFLWIFRSALLTTRFTLLAMAFGFFAISIGLDFLEPPGIDPFLFEDGSKMIGIVCWMTYFASTSFIALSRAADQAWNARLMNPAANSEYTTSFPNPALAIQSKDKRFRPYRRVTGPPGPMPKPFLKKERSPEQESVP